MGGPVDHHPSFSVLFVGDDSVRVIDRDAAGQGRDHRVVEAGSAAHIRIKDPDGDLGASAGLFHLIQAEGGDVFLVFHFLLSFRCSGWDHQNAKAIVRFRNKLTTALPPFQVIVPMVDTQGMGGMAVRYSTFFNNNILLLNFLELFYKEG